LFSMAMLFAVETKAQIQCPDGYSQGTQYRFYYNGCPGTIYYCWKIEDDEPNDVLYTERRVQMDVECDPFPTFNNAFWTFIDLQMFSVIQELGPLLSPALIPPCPDKILYWHEFHAVCYEIENVPPDPIHGFLGVCNLVDCGSNVKCVTRYKVCYNNLSEFLEFEFYDRDILGQPACSTDYPQLPPFGKTWNGYWISECALLNACAM
jgi:hypothetical protein